MDPKRKDLEKFIKNAEEEVSRQERLSKAYFDKKKKTQEAVDDSVPMQTLRVVNDSNTAYSYAQEVREQLKGKKVIVEELDNGKWAVKVPK